MKPAFDASQLAIWQAQLNGFDAMLAAAPDSLRLVRPAPGAWSLQEIVGHLLDSASNNWQRFMRLQVAPTIELSGYDEEQWVAAGHYREASWDELAELWRVLNRQLLRLIAQLPPTCLDHVWRKPGENTERSLKDIVIHYFQHLETHRVHFLKRQAEAAAFRD